MPSVIKQMEKRRKRSPLLPIYGLLIFICLYVVAFALENPVVALINKVRPGFSLQGPDVQFTPTFVMPSSDRLLFAIPLWIVFLALAYFLVAVLTGRDPNSGKELQLPPRTKEERRKRYSRD